ncbi:WxcM-like domain-containing protein [bacterium D16-50]|jgi:WxcM-like, C-terminal.|nr:WxcM-like domain-containing protein [bacterium D16-50]
MDVRKIKFRDIIDLKNEDRPRGHLTPIESAMDIPFEIKRIYYITRVPENTVRGFHAHKKLNQVLICLNGCVTIKVSTPNEEKTFILDNPSEGLYIGTGLWREMYDFTPAAVLLVLASEYYSESDYIRDFDEYCKYVAEPKGEEG